MTYPASVSLQPTSSSDGVSGLQKSLKPEQVVPFLKWPGGKRWLVEKHPRLFQRTFDSYIEPFLGAGSVYFHLAPQKAILSDLNSDLITAYQGIKEDFEAVQILLEKHQLAHCKEHYYAMREVIPSSLAAQAARIIYLNRTCFNGIYRVNRLGKFNVPIGNRTSVVQDTDDFAAIAEMLAEAELQSNDFEEVIDQAQRSDLVFVDPPYTVRHNQNGFIKYNEKLFSWDDQERLAKSVTRAVERGAQVIVTNACHGTVRKLYSSELFRFKRVSRYSAISASLDSRKNFEELVIISRGTEGLGGRCAVK